MKKYTFNLSESGQKLFECEASEIEEASERFKFALRPTPIDSKSVTVIIEDVKC